MREPVYQCLKCGYKGPKSEFDKMSCCPKCGCRVWKKAVIGAKLIKTSELTDTSKVTYRD